MSTCPNGHASQSSDYCDTCGSPMVASSATPSWAGSSGVPDAVAGASEAVAGASGAAAGTSDAGGDMSTGGGEPAMRVCPHCGATSSPNHLFCEDCGYDFTTGALPLSLSEGLAAIDTRVPVSAPPTAPMPATAQPAVPDTTAAPDVPPGFAATPDVRLDPPVAPATGPRPTNQAPSRRAVGDWVVEVWIDPAWFEAQSSDEACPSPAVPDIVRISGRALVGRYSASRRIIPDVDCGTDSGVSRRHAEFTTDGRRWWVEDLGSSNGTFVGPASGPLPEDPIPAGQRVEIDDDDRIYVGAWTRLVLRRATASEIAGTG